MVTLTPALPRPAKAQPLTPHPSIYITNNNFTVGQNGVTNGTGTPQNPYIIAGWDINTTGGAGGAGIHIKNARVYFIIRDIFIHTPPSPGTSGVELENSPNGIVRDVQVTGPENGIFVSTSPFTLVENNNIWNTTYGVYMESGSDNSVVSNNLVRNSTATGMWLSGLAGVYITGNNVTCNNLTCNGYIVTIANSFFDRNTERGAWPRANLTYGYRILSSTDSYFRNNTIVDTPFGFILNGADSGNIATGNHVHGNQYGMGLEGSGSQMNRGNTLSENFLTNNSYGLYTFESPQNKIFDNFLGGNLLGNAIDDNATDGNQWSIPKTLGRNILGGPFLGGNYYSDYTGSDPDADGLGDTPYAVAGAGNLDLLPLMGTQPSVVHDIAVTAVTVQPVSGNQGTNFTVTVGLSNQGSTTETFDMKAYYNGTLLATSTITNLAAQTPTITSMLWATADSIPVGAYNITAWVPPVIGEIVTKNNNASATLSLTQDAPPVAAFTASPLTTPAGGIVNFDASSSHDSDGTIVSYSWSFGDGGTSSGLRPQHSYPSAGTYTVTLTVKDNSGSSTTATATITVTPIGPPPPTAPTSPQNLQVQSSQGAITLTWTMPSDNGGATITDFRIYRGIDPNSLVYYKTVAGSTTSYDDTSVSPGQTYYYKITAVNSAGESQFSNQQSVTLSGSANQPQNQNTTILIASIAGIIIVAAAASVLLLRQRSKKSPETVK